jgi:hypothetical protein
MADQSTLVKRKHPSPMGLSMGSLGPSPDAIGNSTKIRKAVLAPDAVSRVNVCELLDHNATLLSHMAIGPDATEALFRVLELPVVLAFRACGAAMSAMIVGEALDADASLEIYVRVTSQPYFLSVLSSRLPGFGFPTTWAYGVLVLARPGCDYSVKIKSVPSVHALDVAEVPFMSTGLVRDLNEYYGEIVDLTLVLHGEVTLLRSSACRHYANFMQAGYVVHIQDEDAGT